jgi:DNA uptake protein ComE-like DNA-binding protein
MKLPTHNFGTETGRDSLGREFGLRRQSAAATSLFKQCLAQEKRRGASLPAAVQTPRQGSVLVIVLLICVGLISVALYFANSMTLELRASDNRTSGLAAEQAIEGAARYVSSILGTYATNGAIPDLSYYTAEAVAVGNSTRPEENGRFWLIGRDHSGTMSSDPYFALVDEASKLDLNTDWLTADMLATNVPNMTFECAEAIADWRDTNATSSSSTLNYGQSGYLPKHGPFETVGELRLVYGTSAELLAGDDINRNGVLDANENDLYHNGQSDPGLMEYFTVYNREPNTHSDGTALTNVNEMTNLVVLLEQRLGSARAIEISNVVALSQVGQPGAFASLLQFYRVSRMTVDEFAQIYPDVTVTNAPFTVGKVNINTAPEAVLACLPGMNATLAEQVVNYRESNTMNYNSIAWIADALASNTDALQTLAQGDYITAKSFQFTADIAAVGPFGRGYRRMKFVFDISEGTPKIVYRQDLSRLGWALGRQTRETWVARNTR